MFAVMSTNIDVARASRALSMSSFTTELGSIRVWVELICRTVVDGNAWMVCFSNSGARVPAIVGHYRAFLCRGKMKDSGGGEEE